MKSFSLIVVAFALIGNAMLYSYPKPKPSNGVVFTGDIVTVVRHEDREYVIVKCEWFNGAKWTVITHWEPDDNPKGIAQGPSYNSRQEAEEAVPYLRIEYLQVSQQWRLMESAEYRDKKRMEIMSARPAGQNW